MVNTLTPKQALNKAYLKTSITDIQLYNFIENLRVLTNHIDENESEEFHKNLISSFLVNTFYGNSYFINTKGRNDLVIHNGSNAKSSVGVIIETKSPSNKAEMIRTEALNGKALQELVLYYLRERITNNNLEVKYLIATNLYEWFVFDASVFDKLFAQNKSLVKRFKAFEEKRLSGNNTSTFYEEIARPAIAEVANSIVFTHFNIKEFISIIAKSNSIDLQNTGVKKLSNLYKFLSPQHLLKLKVANDSNSLNKEFYNELLYILGLEQATEGNKKIIRRCEPKTRQSASIVENTIIQLEAHDKISRLSKPHLFGENLQERLFNVTLELVITWVNRILFLKLLESQLVSYHKGDTSYKFLNKEKIKDFDDLDKLFFRVLARKVSDRDSAINELFGKVPYLNSSLFEPTSVEHETIFINNLEDYTQLPLYGSTVLKDSTGKKLSGTLSTLEYLFEFLNAYNFSSEGTNEIRKDSKALINASVLGLIFEKINGYKDGSFFTPAFITMYMCRETVRRSVVQKFNDAKGWNCSTIDELYNKIDDIGEANSIINSIKICDPAVGSGHFLVSALNEIIAIKSDLKVLVDRDGRRLKEYTVEIVNDDLIITDEEGDIFEYHPKSKESQRVQEALFHEKQTIIENCLFGVDINPNSVKICRLRLWIELLKNAYYKAPNYTELETLPNIDINIKCGNSLVSRYTLDSDLKTALKKSKWTVDNYRLAVMSYRNAKSKEEKHELERLIESIKNDFESEIARNDKRLDNLNKKKGELFSLTNQTSIFERTKAETTKWEKEVKKLTTDISALETELEEIRNNKIYENAFEWRFEFPEVLNDEGEFVGFDVVIGNPPYVQLQTLGEASRVLGNCGYATYDKGADLYCLFTERGYTLLRTKGIQSFIIPNKWMIVSYGKPLRKFLSKTGMLQMLNFGDVQFFQEATTYSSIFITEKDNMGEVVKVLSLNQKTYNGDFINDVKESIYDYSSSMFDENEWSIMPLSDLGILEQMKKKGIELKQLPISINYGIKTGYNDAFYIDQTTREKLILDDEKSAELIKPMVRGRDISAYGITGSEYLINVHNGIKDQTPPLQPININDYPSIKKHLDTHYHKLEKRGDKGDSPYNLRNCAYLNDFAKPKIMYPNMTSQFPFLYDESGLFSNDKSFILTANDISISLKFLTAVFNSTLAKLWIWYNCPELNGGAREIRKVYFERFPVPQATQEQIQQISALVDEVIEIKKNGSSTTAIEAEINLLVHRLYGLIED